MVAVCATYADNADAYAFCVRRQAAQVSDVLAARALCERLPVVASGECRVAWVEERLHSAVVSSYEGLMPMCEGLPDCAFNLIDSFPTMDTPLQVQRCRELAGPYAADCAGHALQRWARRGPDEESIQAVILAGRDFPWPVGNWVGVIRWCAGKRLPEGAGLGDGAAVGCPAEPRAAKVCIDAMLTADRRGAQCGMPSAVLPPPVPARDRAPVPGPVGPANGSPGVPPRR